ncbi:SdpA family antimicrobial peptide system protein [Streptomyces morookaense]|uniref:SdpA family antimicrobial peptide system protein n=1 Tax=Streptomyces morookaense TaxID=1970 RepID=UPI0033CDFFDA
MSAPDTDALACRRAFRAATAVLAAFILLTVFLSMPGNVLTRSWMGGVKNVFTITAPQGWAFFTKNPQSLDVYAYRAHEGDYTNVLDTPQVKPSNLFGLTRKQRAQGPEMAALAAQVTAWHPCKAVDLQVCLRSGFRQPVKAIHNDSPTATLCGELVLAQEKPTPWAYRHFTPDTSRILDSVHVNVRCGKEGER